MPACGACPGPLEESYGDEMLALMADAAAHPTSELASATDFEPTPRQRFLADAFWSAVQCHCWGRGIDPALVTSGKEVADFFHTRAAGKPVEQFALLQGWRREAVGDAMLQLLAGQHAFTIRWTDQALVVDAKS